MIRFGEPRARAHDNRPMDKLKDTDLFPGILAAIVVTIMGVAVEMNGNGPPPYPPDRDSASAERPATPRPAPSPTPRAARPQNVDEGTREESAAGNIKTNAIHSRYNPAGLPA